MFTEQFIVSYFTPQPFVARLVETGVIGTDIIGIEDWERIKINRVKFVRVRTLKRDPPFILLTDVLEKPVSLLDLTICNVVRFLLFKHLFCI